SALGVEQLEALAQQRHVGRELAARAQRAAEVRLVPRAPRRERAVVLALRRREVLVHVLERDRLDARGADQRAGVALAVEQDGQLTHDRQRRALVLVVPQRRRRGRL